MNEKVFEEKTYREIVKDKNGKYKFVYTTIPALKPWQKKIAKWFIETTMPS